MFLKGELMTYGLQSEDFATYRNSDYTYVTPSETIYFFIFNGYLDAINSREANDGYDTSKYDLQTMTLTTFRKAVAVSYDKELFASTVSPARSAVTVLSVTPISTTRIPVPDIATLIRLRRFSATSTLLTFPSSRALTRLLTPSPVTTL